MKKTKFLWFIIMLFAIMNQIGFAQNSIKGRVTDKTNNEALLFVNVYLPGQNKGTVTDKNGEFVLNYLPKGELKIKFSHVGYKTIIRTIFAENVETILNVEMETAILQAEEVVVSGGMYSTQHENAIKIDLIKGKEIASIGTPTFIEAIFASVPGVDMIAKGTGVAKPVIRGLSMTNILMLNNGVKMENFQFSENHPFIIDEFGIDRIEIIKGPASLLYGSDAVGGVINVLKEKPAPIGKTLGDYNIQFHSNTRGIISHLGIKGSSESFFWGLRGGIKSHTDYRDGNGGYIPNTRFNEYSLKTNVGIRKSYGLFRLYYDYNRPKLGMCVGPAVPLTIENGRYNKFWYQDLTNHIISTRNILFLGKYKIDLNAAHQMNNRRLRTDEYMPFFEMVDMDLSTFSYEIKIYLPSTENSDYIVGLHGANKTNRNNEAPNRVLPDADVNDFSVFGLAQYTFFEKLKAQAGIRYDFRSISTEAEINKEAVNTDYGNVSASLGATCKVNENILLRINFASAYRTPNIAELTQDGMHGARYEQGNPKLKSQRSYQADLGTHFHSKYVMVDISGFYHSINNYIFIAPTDDTIASDDKIYRYSQTNSKIYGGELTIDVLPFDWLNFKTSYAYLIGKQNDGSNLPFIPQNKLRFELKFQKQKLTFLKNTFFKVGGLFAAKQNNPAMFETKTDSYFLLNAGIGTNIKWANQMVSFSVQANNLLNVTYIDHLSTLKGLGYYNIGRNISVNLKIPFGIK